MRLVTFRRGRGEPKPGALWQEHVLDLTGLAKDLAIQRGTVRRGRGGFPRTVLEIIQGGEAILALTREAWEHGRQLVGQTAAEDLAQRRLAYPVKRVRLLAPIPSPARNVFCLGRNYADHAPSGAPPPPSIRCISPSRRPRWWGRATTWCTTPSPRSSTTRSS